MTTTYSLTGRTISLFDVVSVHAVVLGYGIKAIVAVTDGMVLILGNGETVELDLPNARFMADNLADNGHDFEAQSITKALQLIAEVTGDAPKYDLALPEEEPKRWLANVKITSGEKTHKTVHAIDEVSELQDIIEKGPSWGPGYSAEIKLSYAAS